MNNPLKEYFEQAELPNARDKTKNKACRHKWEAVNVGGIGVVNLKVVGLFVCQKCMSYKEEELKFIKGGKKAQ